MDVRYLDEGVVAVTIPVGQSTQTVLVDDFIPTIDGKPSFCYSSVGALWPHFYMKALAKVYPNPNPNPDPDP